MKIRTVIVEDEKPAQEELCFLLELYSQIEVVGVANHGGEGLELILETRPDLVFLDVEMPVMGGVELAQKLYSLRDLLQPKIVFITAYDRFALDAFAVEAVDYLLKPVSEERMKATLERLIPVGRKAEPQKVPLGTGPEMKKIPVEYKGRFKMLPVGEILYFTAEEGCVRAKTRDNSYPAKANLMELEHDLKQQGFFRSHRGYLVNLNKVIEVIPWFKGKYLLVMDDAEKTEVPVSRTYIKELCEIFKI